MSITPNDSKRKGQSQPADSGDSLTSLTSCASSFLSYDLEEEPSKHWANDGSPSFLSDRASFSWASCDYSVDEPRVVSPTQSQQESERDSLCKCALLEDTCNYIPEKREEVLSRENEIFVEPPVKKARCNLKEELKALSNKCALLEDAWKYISEQREEVRKYLSIGGESEVSDVSKDLPEETQQSNAEISLFTNGTKLIVDGRKDPGSARESEVSYNAKKSPEGIQQSNAVISLLTNGATKNDVDHQGCDSSEYRAAFPDLQAEVANIDEPFRKFQSFRNFLASSAFDDYSAASILESETSFQRACPPKMPKRSNSKGRARKAAKTKNNACASLPPLCTPSISPASSIKQKWKVDGPPRAPFRHRGMVTPYHFPDANLDDTKGVATTASTSNTSVATNDFAPTLITKFRPHSEREGPTHHKGNSLTHAIRCEGTLFNKRYVTPQESVESSRGRPKRSLAWRSLQTSVKSLHEIVAGRSASTKKRSSAQTKKFLRPTSNGSFVSFLSPRRSTSRTSSSSSSLSVNRPVGELNIFCSDMVSTDFIFAQLEEAKENTCIVKLEFEDLRERCTEEIAWAIQDVLTHDGRPWEEVHFVDAITIDSHKACRSWHYRKSPFMRDIKRVCKLKFIPTTFCTKLTLRNIPEDCSGKETALSSDEIIALLRLVRKYKSVTILDFATNDVTFAIVQELTELFRRDNRKWESVQLQLTGSSPYETGTEEYELWCEAMESCSAEMQSVALERGVRLN